MSSILKNGWHSKGKGEGGKESWRSDFKGINHVAKLTGRGKDASSSGLQAGLNHSSAPLSTLKDPASFGPPPKHVAAHGKEAAPQPQDKGLASRAHPSPHVGPQTTREPTWRMPLDAARPERQSQTPPCKDDTNTSQYERPSQTVPHLGNPRPALPPRQNSRPDVHTLDPPPSYETVATALPQKSGQITQPSIDRLHGQGLKMPLSKASSSSVVLPSFASPIKGTGWTTSHKGSTPQVQDIRSSSTAAQSHQLRQVGAQKQNASHIASSSQANLSIPINDESSTAVEHLARDKSEVQKGASSRKQPPPPPPKKKEFKAIQSNPENQPPPVPMSTKPKF